MARELNPRQQRFVAEYVKTGVAAQAYIAAGYQVTTRWALDTNASRLLRHAQVKAAIRQKRQQMLKRSDVTIEKLLQDVEDARKLAMAGGQPSAAVSASQLQGKLVGLLIDRKESGAPGDFTGLATPEQIVEAIRAELGEDAASLVQRAVTPAEARQEAIEQEAMPTAGDTIN